MVDPRFAERIVEQAPHALFATDTAGRVVYWNRAAEAMYGHAEAEVLGVPLRELFGDAAGAGADGTVERVRRCRNGSLIYVHSTTRTLAGGEPGWLYSEVDVTPLRVRREANLIDTRYRGLLESVPDAIVIVDGIGRIVFVNQQAQQMFGYRPEQLQGEVIERLMPDRYRGVHTEHRGAYLASSRIRPMGQGLELRGLRAGGDEFPVEISLSPLDTELGRMGMSAIRDISERHRVERALHDKNIELERASQAKDSFLATMSHELRTPLNAIIGFTGLLLMKLAGPLTADQERQLRLVQNSGQHLLSLINDLLDVAKIDSGKVLLQPEAVDARALVDEVVATLRQAAETKGLTLRVGVPAGEPFELHTDRRALRQVLINLTNNAIKFTDAGGVTIGLERRGEGIDVAIADTGIGISEADQARLFQPFTQVGGGAGRARVEGTGLGLYLCRKLAELMGGNLRVTSVPGQGSVFRLALPARLRTGGGP